MPLARSITSKMPKPDRNKIDLSDEAVARRWAKKLGKSREDIAAAIEKVGDNCESVRKELGVKGDVCANPPAKTSV
jgi:hypothetical protein